MTYDKTSWSGLTAYITYENGQRYVEVTCQYWTLFKMPISESDMLRIMANGRFIDSKFEKPLSGEQSA